MSYYMGDYYGRGSFYRGDPGFFSFLGKVAKGVFSSVTGISLGGKAAAPAAGMAAGVLKALPGGVGKLAGRVGGVLKKVPRGVLVAGGAAAAGAAVGAGGRALMEGGGRRRRRMNVANIKALRRSIRRAQGFARVAKKVLRFTSPKAPRGRAVFKRRTRKRV